MVWQNIVKVTLAFTFDNIVSIILPTQMKNACAPIVMMQEWSIVASREVKHSS